MTPELLSAIAATIVSLLIEWVPPFANWFQPLDVSAKKLVSLALFILVGAAVYGLSCAGLAEQLGIPAVVCDQSGVIVLLKAVFGAVVASQAIHKLTKRPSAQG